MVELLLNGQVAVVDDNGIFGLGKRAVVARTVDAVAVFEVGNDIFEIDCSASSGEFCMPSLSPGLQACRHEKFQFSMGQYHRANVATVHDHPA